jgi:hyperosmotically inducible periplasmic protein
LIYVKAAAGHRLHLDASVRAPEAGAWGNRLTVLAPHRHIVRSNMESANMKKSLWMPFVVALALAMPIAACTSTRTSDSTGEYIDDSAITAKVKGALAADSFLSSFDIGVETEKDVVQLSGFVNSPQIKDRAGQLTAGISGVRGVRNNLIVK